MPIEEPCDDIVNAIITLPESILKVAEKDKQAKERERVLEE